MFSIDLTYLCRHNIENTAGFNYMNRRYYCMFIVLFFAVLTQAAAAERTFNILFIQSYTSQTPWHSDLNQGLAKGFKESGLKVNITTEYLDADFWAFNSEKVIMRRFCQRARDRQTDLIVTASDEAFYTLFACGDSLPLQIPDRIIVWEAAMRYQKANEILPVELVELIQDYIDGEYVYIPRKQENNRSVRESGTI